MNGTNAATLRRAALTGIAGGLITGVGGAVVQIAIQPSTHVSDKMWSYPWSSTTLVPVSLLWALAHVLVAIGILGVAWSGLAGPSAMARRGFRLALTGTALLFTGELASIVIRHAHAGDTSASVVGGIFALGTLCSAIGFLLAGKAALSAGLWREWRRYTLLITGICTTALLAVVSGNALPAGVAIYGFCQLALGLALYTQPTPAPARAAVPAGPSRVGIRL